MTNREKLSEQTETIREKLEIYTKAENKLTEVDGFNDIDTVPNFLEADRLLNRALNAKSNLINDITVKKYNLDDEYITE